MAVQKSNHKRGACIPKTKLRILSESNGIQKMEPSKNKITQKEESTRYSTEKDAKAHTGSNRLAKNPNSTIESEVTGTNPNETLKTPALQTEDITPDGSNENTTDVHVTASESDPAKNNHADMADELVTLNLGPASPLPYMRAYVEAQRNSTHIDVAPGENGVADLSSWGTNTTERRRTEVLAQMQSMIDKSDMLPPDYSLGAIDASSHAGIVRPAGREWDGQRVSDVVSSKPNPQTQLAVPPQTKLCGKCGKTASHQCSKCFAQFYCSLSCQEVHWKVHKNDCKKAQKKLCKKGLSTFQMPAVPPTKLMLKELEVGKVHSKCYVEITIINEPFKMTAVMFTAADDDNSHMVMSVYGYPDCQPQSLGQIKGGMAVPSTLKNSLSKGAKLRVYDPWCKVAMDGQIIIRVDNYRTIEFI